MLPLLLTLAAGLPIDDLVQHQHGQMLRYWQRQATSVTPPGCAAQPPVTDADPILTPRLRGKSRRQILDRLRIVSAPADNHPVPPPCGPPPPPMGDAEFAAQLAQLQSRIHQAEATRRQHWNLTRTMPVQAVPKLIAGLKSLTGYRDEKRLPLQPQLRLHGETQAFTAYEVLLPTLEDFDAYGHLLIPKNRNSKAAAVIVQHGLGGQPKDLTCVGPAPDKAYHCLGAHLADQGFVVFAPYVTHPLPVAERINPLATLARSVGRMRISAELVKLHQIVDFLQSRPEIEPARIGYYGLSYGGYSALWMGPLEPRLKAIVVSGHFNDWREKITNLENPTSYMFHPDEDFYNFDVLRHFTHPELIAAMWPRPVCVEFAEDDGTTTPQWHQRAWNQVTEIAQAWKATFVRDHFNGVHEIHGVGTVDFLNRHLRPERPAGRDSDELISQRLQAPVQGIFYGEGAFTGIAFRAAQRGAPQKLAVKFGRAPGAADLGIATLTSVTDGWVEARIPAQQLSKGRDYFFELATEPAEGYYELFGPRPMGGSRWERDFAVSYRLLR